MNKGVKKRLLADGVWMYASSIAGALALFVVSIVWSHILPPLVIGEYTFIISCIGLASICTLPGMRNATTQAISRGYAGNYRKGIAISFAYALWGTALLFLLAASLDKGAGIREALILTAFLFPFYSVASFFGTRYIAERQFKKNALVNFGGTLATAGAMIASAYLFHNLFSLVSVSLAVPLMIYGPITAQLYRTTPKNAASDDAAISFGKKISLAEILSTLAFHADTVIIGLYLGFSGAALYFFIKLIPEQMKDIAKIIGAMALPEFSRMPKEELRRSLTAYFVMTLYVMAAMVCIYVLLAPLFFKIFLENYSEMVPYSQIFALSAITFANNVIYQAFQARLLTKEVFLLNTLPATASILLLFLLLPLYGLLGAVLAKVLSRFFALALSVWLLKRSPIFAEAPLAHMS